MPRALQKRGGSALESFWLMKWACCALPFGFPYPCIVLHLQTVYHSGLKTSGGIAHNVCRSIYFSGLWQLWSAGSARLLFTSRRLWIGNFMPDPQADTN